MNIAEELRAPLFAVDARYDRDYASDGRSRYGAYLRQGLTQLDDDDRWVFEDPVGWAMFCWDRATVPVMSPPYLAWSDPIETVLLSRGDTEGLVAEVIVKVRPGRLPTGWRTWQRSLPGRLEPPADDRRPVALGRVSLIVPVPTSALPDPPARCRPPNGELNRAKISVSCLARLLTDAVTQAIPSIGGEDATSW